MARKKCRTGRKNEIENLSMALVKNGEAILTGPKRKHWSTQDIKTIKPLTPTQEDTFHAWQNYEHICLHGSAGTGKTFLALYLAMKEVLAKRQQKTIIVRSAVPTREVGFLPGTLEEKMAQYEHPYHDIMYELIGRSSTYQDMKDSGLIEFMSTSFIRGLTWDNAIIIVEEGENMTFHEIDSIMTRVGQNSRVIFTGDSKQTDLDGSKRMGTSGMDDALDIFDGISDFSCIEFTRNDIVRSKFVKSWIIASEDVA